MASRIVTHPFPRAFHLAIAACFFMAVALYGSLVPFEFEPIAWDQIRQQISQPEFWKIEFQSKTDWIANTLLSVPIGFFALGALRLDRSASLFAAIIATAFIVLLCAVFAVGLELSQFWFLNRVSSVNDIAAQTLGGCIGATTWLLGGRWLVQGTRTIAGNSPVDRKLAWLFQLYFLGFLVYNFMPFDFTLRLTEIARKIEQGRIRLVPFSDVDIWNAEALLYLAIDITLWIPIGAGIAFFLSGLRQRVIHWMCVGAVALFSAGVLEAAQLLVQSRVTSTTDVCTAWFGALLGAILTHRLLNLDVEELPVIETEGGWISHSNRFEIRWGWLVAAVICMLFLVGHHWKPWDFQTDLPSFKASIKSLLRTPFVVLQRGNYFNALDQIIQKIVSFAVLGGLLAYSFRVRLDGTWWRRLCWGSVWCLSILFGATLEIGQLFLPSRISDLTDMVLFSLGSLCGLWIGNQLQPETERARASGGREVSES